MDKFIMKDSGERQEYSSGMRRDIQVGKPRYDLLDRDMLKRWAILMSKGAEKYGENNWKLANSEEELNRFLSSALRHMMQWANQERDEDHGAAVMFNIAAYEYIKKKLEIVETVTVKVQNTLRNGRPLSDYNQKMWNDPIGSPINPNYRQ